MINIHMAETIIRSICIGQECYLTLKIPIVVVIAGALLGLAALTWYHFSNGVIPKDSSFTKCTETFVFHNDIMNLLKDYGVETIEYSIKDAASQSNLQISSKLDASLALACLAQVREAKQQLQQVKDQKEAEVATLRSSVSIAIENLESEYGHALEAERAANSILRAEVAALKTKCKDNEAKIQQLVKLQTKFESKKRLADDLKRKVLDYEKQLLTFSNFETLQTDLSEQMEECKSMTHSLVDISETNRELTIQVEQIVAKLNNEAGRIHGVAITPEGQIRGKIVKTDATSISMITSMSSASSAMTPATRDPPKEEIIDATRGVTTPKRLFRRKVSSQTFKNKKKDISSSIVK